jgi:hypothetical protein
MTEIGALYPAGIWTVRPGHEAAFIKTRDYLSRWTTANMRDVFHKQTKHGWAVTWPRQPRRAPPRGAKLRNHVSGESEGAAVLRNTCEHNAHPSGPSTTPDPHQEKKAFSFIPDGPAEYSTGHFLQ